MCLFIYCLALCCICTSVLFCTKCSSFLPHVSYLWWLGLRVHPTCWSGVLRGKSIRYPSPCLETARSPLFVSNTTVWLTFSNKSNEPKVMLTTRIQLHIMKKTSSGHLRLWCESHSCAGRARLQRPEWRDHTYSLQWLVWTIAGGILSLVVTAHKVFNDYWKYQMLNKSGLTCGKTVWRVERGDKSCFWQIHLACNFLIQVIPQFLLEKVITQSERVLWPGTWTYTCKKRAGLRLECTENHLLCCCVSVF